MKKLSMIIAIVCMMISPMMQAQNDGVDKDSIVGSYITEDLDEIEVYKVGDKYLGKIIKLNVPIDPQTNKPLKDKHNPDASLKDREVKGLTFLIDCKFDYNEWEKGRYYNYKEGETYDCKMMFIINQQNEVKLSVNTYNAAGGKTTYWTKKKTN